MTATINPDGGLNVPAGLLRQDGITPGQQVEVERLDTGLYRVARRNGESDWRLVDWLLQCPEKDYFVPVPMLDVRQSK